jgi:hypothetical protein
MRTLSNQEKRTVRIGAIAIGIYLVLFGGFKIWGWLERKRVEYRQVMKEATDLKRTIQPFEGKVRDAAELMERFHMDPAKLSRKSVVMEASSAIQKAAMGSGIQVGPVREPPARNATSELALQFEGTGPVPAVMGLLSRLESVGYPLIIDTVQITPETSRPGQVKINLTVLILDFEQWKGEGMPNA